MPRYFTPIQQKSINRIIGFKEILTETKFIEEPCLALQEQLVQVEVIIDVLLGEVKKLKASLSKT